MIGWWTMDFGVIYSIVGLIVVVGGAASAVIFGVIRLIVYLTRKHDKIDNMSPVDDRLNDHEARISYNESQIKLQWAKIDAQANNDERYNNDVLEKIKQTENSHDLILRVLKIIACKVGADEALEILDKGTIIKVKQ